MKCPKCNSKEIVTKFLDKKDPGKLVKMDAPGNVEYVVCDDCGWCKKATEVVPARLKHIREEHPKIWKKITKRYLSPDIFGFLNSKL